MKKQLSVVLPLFAAVSMSMAHAQELLFTATLQDKLANRNELKGEIFPITFQNQTIGFVIGLSQKTPGKTDGSYPSYTYTDAVSQISLSVFSPSGKLLQSLPTSSKYNSIDDIQLLPFGDGGFCVIIESENLQNGYGGSHVDARAEEHFFYAYSNGTWKETRKFLTGAGDNDESIWPDIANPTATFALFKDAGDKVVAEVYVANKKSLTPNPLPAITSNLAPLRAKSGASIRYSTTANFKAIEFSAIGLPSGLTINSSTGLISGKTQSKGTHSVMLIASQAGGQPVVAVKKFIIN
ncbi:MAG: Ig domain-containing protein [Verrucomicrobiota bacterium]